MPKFRVLDGSHTEPDGEGDVRFYKKGDVVESELQLDEVFVNKFRQLKNSAPVTDAPTLEEVATADQTRARKEAKKAKDAAIDQFELEDGEEPDEEEAVEEEKYTPVKSKLGKDVSSEFPVALEEGLIVLKKDKRFQVAEKDAPNKALTDEPVTRKGAEAFIKEYVG